MDLVAERMNEVVVLPVRDILQEVVPDQVEKVHPKVERGIVCQEEGQEWIHCAGVLLSHVED